MLQLPAFCLYCHGPATCVEACADCKLKVDVGQVHGVNCFTARWNWQGIAATAETRVARDVAGQRLKIRFEIVDRRFGVLAGPVKEGEVDPNRVQRGPYTVYLTLQVCAMLIMYHRTAVAQLSVHDTVQLRILCVANGADFQYAMLAVSKCLDATGMLSSSAGLQGMTAEVIGRGDAPVIGMTDTYAVPGVYTLEVPCPTTRSTGTIHLEMWDEDKVSFVHEFSLSFHMSYAKLLKWLVALPFTITAAVVINVLSSRDLLSSASLPMFRTGGERTK